MTTSNSQELLDELNQKKKRMRLWPFMMVLGVTALVVLGQVGAPGWSTVAVGVLGVATTLLVVHWDRSRRTAVLMYDMDSDAVRECRELHTAGDRLAACKGVWHIEAQGDVRDAKYHAGASHLIRRNVTRVKQDGPPGLKTNISVISIGVGRQTLYFFPDRALVYDKNGIGAVDYQDLEAAAESTRFIENGRVPRDAKVVDKTWRYVNKKGGPDRRFKHNPLLPICEYEELRLSSRTGLNEVLQLSVAGASKDFVAALATLAKHDPRAKTAAS